MNTDYEIDNEDKSIYQQAMDENASLRVQLAEKDKQILWLQGKLETAIALGDEMRNALKKVEAENAELRERLKAVKKTYNQWAILDEPQYPHEAIENFISQRGNESWQAIKKAVGNESSDNR